MLELRGVGKVDGGAVHIAPTDLVLAPGSLNVLLGPTGAGKTTLLRLMAGLERPTSGEVWFGGKDVTAQPVRRRDVAMVYQSFINYPSLSVFENIASPLRVAGLGRDEVERRVAEAAELLRLTPYLSRKPLELSGGQQQRTALARAIVKGAGLVLLDEPLANLDYKLREELRAELPRLFGQTGAILVYATTEPAEALMLGGQTATLSEGRITQFGPTIEVFRRPRDLITARTFSDPPLNTAAVRKSGRSFDLAGLALAAPEGPDGDYVIGVRPHHLTLAGAGLPATVQAVEITGSESFIHVEAAGERWVVLAPGVTRLQAGDAIHLSIDPARLMVFAPDGARLAA